MNKIQLLAKKSGVKNQNELRSMLRPYRVAGGTVHKIWTEGANTQNRYSVIMALEKVFSIPAEKFLEDPENLSPVKNERRW